MKIHQIRNASMVVELGEHRILVDPMIGEKGSVRGLGFSKGFKQFGKTDDLANPIVDMPENAQGLLDTVTEVLITHNHPDHLDPPAVEWLKEKQLPVWTSALDVAGFTKRGMNCKEFTDGALGFKVELVPTLHGHGAIGYFMGPGVGYYLSMPGEPSLYITGDTVLTPEVREAIERLEPDVIVAPAGSANIGAGEDILFTFEELVELGKMSKKINGKIVYNHLEALDHCPTSRTSLRDRLRKEELDNALVPEDGDCLTFSAKKTADEYEDPPIKHVELKGGFQKFVADLF